MQFLIIQVQDIKKQHHHPVTLHTRLILIMVTLSMRLLLRQGKKGTAGKQLTKAIYPQFASQIMCQVNKAHMLPRTGNYPLLLAHTHILGIF